MKFKFCKSGFTLIELLISLSIMAVIMVAVGVAIDASVQNYNAVNDMSTAMVKANQLLGQIVVNLRCASAVNISEPNSQCSLLTAEGNDITYRFSSSDEKLYLDDNDSSQTYLMCDNISSAFFVKTTDVNDSNVAYVKNVQIVLDIKAGSTTQRATRAVSLVKNLD